MPDKGMNYSEAWYIRLHEGEDNRVNTEEMRKDAERDDAEAAEMFGSSNIVLTLVD